MSWFQCCMSEERVNRNSLKKSIKEYDDTKTLASFANLSFKSGENRGRYTKKKIKKLGKGKILAQTFTFRELCVATNNFNHQNLLGEGGFGRVYKALIPSAKQITAVKRLDPNGFQGDREFLVEVLMLSLLHHPNLVNLVGYCADANQRILVYEYMPNGSLEDHLFGSSTLQQCFISEDGIISGTPSNKPPLDWNTRMKIVEGVARGLEYLHETVKPAPVIYRDFKASNILLDEEFNAKLSDFGLAKIGPIGDNSHVSTRVMGTYGYCAPEYALTGQLSTKSDVYSFGVVFLEIITGRRVIDTTKPSAQKNLISWAQPLFKDRRKFTLMADPKLEGNYPVKALYQALAVVAMCLQDEPNTRPLISDVVTALQYLAVNKDVDEDVDGELSDSESVSGSEFSSYSCSTSPDRNYIGGKNVDVEGDGR